MNENIKIDIVIPYYNASSTIDKTFMSIAIQNIKDKTHTIVIDDCSSEEESMKLLELIEFYKTYFSIEYYRLDKNSGPGVARHEGLNKCTHEYVTFIDADDVFATSTALFVLLYQLETHEKSDIVSAPFLEEVHTREDVFDSIQSHTHDMTWMFGKLYRRSFLDKYNINFNISRANEDSGFNGLCLLCSNDDTIIYIDDVVYCWNYNPNSITKNNDYNYNGLRGYIYNHIWSIHKALEIYVNNKDSINGSNIVCHTLNTLTLIFLYKMNLILTERTQEELEEYDRWALDFYRDVYIYIRHNITDEVFIQCYNTTWELHKDLIGNNILPKSIFDYLESLNNKMLKELDVIQALDNQGNFIGYVKKDIVDSDKEIAEEDIIGIDKINKYLHNPDYIFKKIT